VCPCAPHHFPNTPLPPVASYLAKANYSHDQDPVTTAKLTVTRGLLCLHEASSANSPPLASLSYSLAADHFTTVDIVIGMEYADIVTTEGERCEELRDGRKRKKEQKGRSRRAGAEGQEQKGRS